MHTDISVELNSWFLIEKVKPGVFSVYVFSATSLRIETTMLTVMNWTIVDAKVRIIV